jgi:hypothetical protein
MNVFYQEKHIKDVRQQWIEWIEDNKGDRSPVHHDEWVPVQVIASGELFGSPQKLLTGEYNCVLTLNFNVDGTLARYFSGCNASSAEDAKENCERLFIEQVEWFSRITEDDNRSEARVFRQEGVTEW